MPDSFFANKTRKRKRTTTRDVGPTSSKKVARTGPGRAPVKGKVNVKGKGRAVDEELESDVTGDEGVDDMDLGAEDVDPHESGEEDEDETPAEKRLRLAKLYLESVKEGLAEGEFDAAEIDKELISSRLKQDVMIHAGKVHLFIADNYDLSQEPPTLRTRGHRFSVTSAVASEDGRYLFTSGKEGSIIKWDLRSGSRLKTFPKLHPGKTKGKGKEKASVTDVPGHTDEVLTLALSGDGKYLASAGKDRKVGVWDVEKGEWVKGFGGHRDTISSIAFRKGTQQLYSASFDRTIKLFDLSVMGYVETLFGHQDSVLALDALRSETAVSVGGRDKTARFWKIVDESQLVFRGGGRSSVRELLEGGALEGLEEDGDVEPRKKERKEQKRYVEGSLESVAMIDETTFLSGGDSGSICLWTTQKKKPIYTQAIAHGFNEVHSETEGLIQTPRWITALGSLRYSDLFASGSWEGEIRLWKIDPKLRSFSLVGTVSAPGVINSLQLISPPKGSLDGVSWAQDRPQGEHARPVAAVTSIKTPLVLLVAGVGQETRLGRWVTVKDGVRNGALVFALHPTLH
ncbi:WD40 repeat-like protein [Artomyces pyxidatus]|uniref:WD40 repeat-like protein n=1 Tax=Artomyces pyxidatus TaxID=48021 RepID=A0ACB8SXE5_9AGAM|nr:WD40 repeat-like protein [Artomyces pyxidatus]